MNRRKIGKRSLTWLLVLSMIFSLFGGEIVLPQKAKAAGTEATINFGSPKISADGYYTYPDVTVSLPDASKRIHNLTVTVDSGYIRTTETSIEDWQGNKVPGQGISSAGMSAGSGIEDLSDDSTAKYESITFEFDAYYSANEQARAQGASVSEVQAFLSQLRFTTSKTAGQKVTITATTLGNTDLTTKVDGQNITLHYYNGHFYGYVSKWCSWRQAYDGSAAASFKGVKGYLATLTSRGEDRFLYSTFPEDNTTVKAKKGWIGCTRATLDSVEAGTEAEDVKSHKMESKNDPNFVWHWVSGPEAGQNFGQQTTAYGFGSGDGGFEAYDGFFSNWGNDSDNHIEPNGGYQTNEGFGYYGNYDYGRWNDFPADWSLSGYYVEFGGMKGDDETLKDNLGDEIIVTSNKTEPDVVNPEVTNPTVTKDPDKKSLTGQPVIVKADEDADIAVGTKLKADVSGVGPAGATYKYKWYVQDPDSGVWKLQNTSDDNLVLTEDTLDHNIKVELVGTGEYADSKVESDPFDATRTKQPLTGNPVIKTKNDDDKLEPGTILVADLTDLTADEDSEIGNKVDYSWIVVEPDGTETDTGITGPDYAIKSSDLGKKIYLKVTAKEDSIDYTGSSKSNTIMLPAAPTATPAPSDAAPELTAISGRPTIVNDVTDEEGNPKNEVGTVLKADVEGIAPAGARDSLTYQWYIREKNGTLTKIEGATGSTLTLTENELDKNLVVSVTASEDAGYYGTSRSFPYTAAQEKIAISGPVKIVNETKNKDTVTGEEYEVKHEGTVLTADITGIDPEDSHDSLTYQWYVKEKDGTRTPIPDATDRSYILTSDEVDKEIEVEVTGNGKYKGTLTSNSYDTTRTDADVKIDDSEEDGKRKIIVSPTMKDTVYAIAKVSDPNKTLTVDDGIIVEDGNGNVFQSPDYFEEYKGYYYKTVEGGKLTFTVPKDGEYVIIARRDTKLDVVIISPEISGEITDYDDKQTLDNNEDDTISIVVEAGEDNNKNPQDYRYAILKKENGKYYDMTIRYDADKKEYVYDDTLSEDSNLTNGGEGRIVFSNLPADGTYKIVAIEIGDNLGSNEIDEMFKGLKPSQIQGGSADIISTPKPIQQKPSSDPNASSQPGSSSDPNASSQPGNSADPNASSQPGGSADPNASSQPGNSAVPNASGQPGSSSVPNTTSGPADSNKPGVTNTNAPIYNLVTTEPAQILTPDQQSRVDKFVNEHGKDSAGNIIKKVDDKTKDIVVSGKQDWNKLTPEEQAAVNQKLKDGGCPYTYPELLKLANKYKIPGFKLHKVMKKNSKAKLKLMKCKGATIIVTTTNKKVATVNKKGVIKAKKKGKATLTITAIKGDHTSRLVVNIEVRKKFKNATELKKFKSKRIKTPTILIAKKRRLKKSTKIKIYGLEKNAKVKFKSFNKKALPINKKGRYTAKKKGKSLMRVTVKQNKKTYYLYLYVTAFKAGKAKKK